MPKAIPTLGYPTRTAAILALTAKGEDIRLIAKKIGITPKQAECLLYAERSNRSPRGTMQIEKSILSALDPHAKQRNLNSRQLAERILKVVAESGLIDAVLDDLRDQPRKSIYAPQQVSA